MPAGEPDRRRAVAGHRSRPSLGGAVIAFMNPGGVRNPGFASARPATRRRDLRRSLHGAALRQQPGDDDAHGAAAQGRARAAVRRLPGQGTQRILQISERREVHMERDRTRPAEDRRRQLTPTDVTVNPPAARCARDDRRRRRRAEPGQDLPRDDEQLPGHRRRRLHELLGGTAALGGAQDIDALTAYLASYKAPGAAAYDPPRRRCNKPRITRLP